MAYGPDDTHTAFPSIAIEAMGWGASGPVQLLRVRLYFASYRSSVYLSNLPTNSRPIFPPSHMAHALPKQVSRWIRGPSVAPLCERVCRTNGTAFVMRPSARNGAKRRGSCLELGGSTASIRARFLGGGLGCVSLFAPMVAGISRPDSEGRA